MKEIPEAFKEDGHLAPELSRPISFGSNKYYVPNEDLAPLAASYDSISALKGKDAGDEFARRIREKARFYRARADRLDEDLRSPKHSALSAEKREALADRHYREARALSAQGDIQGSTVLTSVHAENTIEAYLSDRYSFCDVDARGDVESRPMWVSPGRPGSGDTSLLTDRGLQTQEAAGRFYDDSGTPRTVGTLTIPSSQVGTRFEVLDPDSAAARDQHPQHIPFGYSSGGLREFSLSLSSDYLESKVAEAKQRLDSTRPESRLDDAKLRRSINDDVLGPSRAGAECFTHAQSFTVYKEHSFDNPESSFNPELYRTNAKNELAAASTKDVSAPDRSRRTEPSGSRASHEESAVGKSERENALSSMRSSLNSNRNPKKTKGVR